LSSGGHPPPLRREAVGTVAPVAMRPSRMLGSPMLDPELTDTHLTLWPEETLVLYTDGFTEARSPDGDLFGVERLCQVLGGARAALPLDQCAAEASAAVRRFTGQDELQDDQTLLLLRRRGESPLAASQGARPQGARQHPPPPRKPTPPRTGTGPKPPRGL